MKPLTNKSHKQKISMCTNITTSVLRNNGTAASRGSTYDIGNNILQLSLGYEKSIHLSYVGKHSIYCSSYAQAGVYKVRPHPSLVNIYSLQYFGAKQSTKHKFACINCPYLGGTRAKSKCVKGASSRTLLCA